MFPTLFSRGKPFPISCLTGTAIEINACANLVNPSFSDRLVKEYTAFLAMVAEEGPCFACGSDAHAIGGLQHIRSAWQVAEHIHLTADRIWRPSEQPMVGGKRHGAA